MNYCGLELHNVADMVAGESGNLICCRLPAAVRAQCNPGCQNAARAAANVEMRCQPGKDAAIDLFVEGQTEERVEIYQGDFLVGQQRVGPGRCTLPLALHAKTDILVTLAERHGSVFDPHLLRVCFDRETRVGVLGVSGEVTLPSPGQTPALRYLAYGSSITHGCGLSVIDGYASRTAQLLGADLLNMGFSGAAHCEVELADYLAARDDWDFASLEMGVNLIGILDPTPFRTRVEEFVRRISASGRPVYCIDMWRHEADYGTHDPWKQVAFRQVVREVVAELHLPHVIHVDGSVAPRMLDGLSADLVHPSPAGMADMAAYLAGVMHDGRNHASH